MDDLLPTLDTGVFMIITLFHRADNRLKAIKKRYQSFALKRLIPPCLLILIQFFLELSDFLLIVADAVDLHTAEYTDADAAADQDSRKQPCKLAHSTSPSLRPRLRLAGMPSEQRPRQAPAADY